MTELTKRVAIKQLDEEGHGLARIARLSEIDKDGDTYQAGAFGDQFAMVLPAHNWTSVPLGKARVFEQGDEALGEFEFNLDTDAGREWHAAVKFDLNDGREPLQEWSFGFDILDSSMEVRDGERIRVLKRLDVHEISPVIVGAGVGTGTLQVKNADGPIHERMIKAADDLVAMAARVAAEEGELTPAQQVEVSAIKDAIARVTHADQVLENVLNPTPADTDALADAGRLAAKFAFNQSPHARLAVSGCCKVGGTRVKGQRLGSMLRELRDDQELDNAALADAAGIDVSTMGAILSGDINCPPLERLNGLADLLDVPASRLRSAAEADGCVYE